MQISTLRDGYTSVNAFEDIPQLGYLNHNGKEYANSKWCSAQSHDVPALMIQRVKKQIAEKAAKVVGYQPCDAYWLLFIVEFWDPAQDQDIDWPANERVGPTPFERILIYKPSFKQVVEIAQ